MLSDSLSVVIMLFAPSKSECIQAILIRHQSTVCALLPSTRRMSQSMYRGRHVQDHIQYLTFSVVTRNPRKRKVNNFCQCLAKDVSQQCAPTLGQAERIGEAKNPGPRSKSCMLNVILANPTSLANKKDTLTQLLTEEQANIVCLAETSATQEVQSQCQKDLAKLGYKAFATENMPDRRSKRKRQSWGDGHFCRCSHACQQKSNAKRMGINDKMCIYHCQLGAVTCAGFFSLQYPPKPQQCQGIPE